MMQGDYQIIYDRQYHWMMTSDALKVSMLLDSEVIHLNNVAENHTILAAENKVLVMRCDMAHNLIYSNNYNFNSSKPPSDSFYILPEKMLTMYENFMTARFSPFSERLEEISLQIFESGIKQHWKILLHKLTNQFDLEVSYIVNEEYMLKMSGNMFSLCF